MSLEMAIFTACPIFEHYCYFNHSTTEVVKHYLEIYQWVYEMDVVYKSPIKYIARLNCNVIG